MVKQQTHNLPTHVAFIVDGNRRWAQKNHKPIFAGHQYVVDKTLDLIVTEALKLQIPYLTFWAFSTENWKRGQEFVDKLFGLLAYALDKSVDKYQKKGVHFNVIGDLSKIPTKLTKKILDLKEESKTNNQLTVTLALNYGGRDEILRAVKKLVKEGKFTNQNIDKLTETDFAKYLDTADLPDPDMIIRTGGDLRLSGFLTWQSQYAELFFTKTLMPDFSIMEFNQIINDYALRDRRFGGNSSK